MFRTARLAVAALTLAAAGALPLVTAAPAHAHPVQCSDYLWEHGYEESVLGNDCLYGSVGMVHECMERLMKDGVPDDVAYPACLLAAEK